MSATSRWGTTMTATTMSPTTIGGLPLGGLPLGGLAKYIGFPRKPSVCLFVYFTSVHADPKESQGSGQGILDSLVYVYSCRRCFHTSILGNSILGYTAFQERNSSRLVARPTM